MYKLFGYWDIMLKKKEYECNSVYKAELPFCHIEYSFQYNYLLGILPSKNKFAKSVV